MRYHLTEVSSNKKTGPIPVSTTSSDTCPPACPFNDGGCYAKSGPLALHWKKVSEDQRGDDFDTFIDKIKKLPKNQLFRHNQAEICSDLATGSMPHNCKNSPLPPSVLIALHTLTSPLLKPTCKRYAKQTSTLLSTYQRIIRRMRTNYWRMASLL